MESCRECGERKVAKKLNAEIYRSSVGTEILDRLEKDLYLNWKFLTKRKILNNFNKIFENVCSGLSEAMFKKLR